MKYFNYILLFSIISICYGYSHDRDKVGVSLKNVITVLFKKGEWVTGIGNESIPQLVCIGGDAQPESDRVESIMCKNNGLDEADIIWECDTNLDDDDIKISNITVICKVYDYSENSEGVIFYSICTAGYILDYTENRYTEKRKETLKELSNTNHIFYITWIVVFAIGYYYILHWKKIFDIAIFIIGINYLVTYTISYFCDIWGYPYVSMCACVYPWHKKLQQKKMD